MKIRSNFVANSSSCTTIIIWKDIKERGLSIIDAIIDLMDLEYLGKTKTGEINFTGKDVEEFKASYTDIINNTELVHDSIYKSTFSTGMLNSERDMGHSFQDFCSRLILESGKYVIINIEVDKDDG